MEFRKWIGNVPFGLAATALLSGCGGDGSSSAVSSASAFTEAVGLTPVASTMPAALPSPAASPKPAPAAPVAPSAFSNAKWVDFQNGDDSNDGTSKARAWKHAPGDPEATGVAAAYKPAAGDQIVFAAGSRYFGSITAEFSGTAQAPIVFTGESDTQPSYIDGSSFSGRAQRCTSQSACHGVAAWQGVSIVRFDKALPEGAQLYANGSVLTPAQWPNPADLFYNEETDEMADEAGANLNAGVANVPAAVSSMMPSVDDLRVAVWVRSNKIAERRATGVRAGKVTFDNTKIDSYTDRTSKFALVGHAALIDKAGEYAILPDRKTVLVKSDDASPTIYASTGRGGFDLAGANHVTVRNLTFEHMSDLDGKVRTGLPISVQRKPASNLRIEQNRFNDLVLTQGMGAVTLWDVTNATISGNVMTRIAYGSGMRILRSKNTLIHGNAISRIGRTGIMLMSNDNTQVVKNRIWDIRGVHGNGFSAYLGNQHTRVVANTILEAKQAATIHGNGDKLPVATDILFANNLFVAMDDSLGALISWGGGDKITLNNNVMLGGDKGAVRLAKDTKVTIKRNVLAGILFSDYYPSDWSITNNVFTVLTGSQTKRYKNDAVMSSLLESRSLDGKAPANLAKFCPYITELLDYTFLGQTYGRSIGADFTCS